MTNISDRIAQVIAYLNVSTRSFEQQIGCSNGVIARCISKGTDISSFWVSKIIEIHSAINPDWLLTGRGTMLLSESQTLQVEIPNDSPLINKLFDTIEKKDLKIEELLKENARLEERLRLLESDKSDFIKIAEDASTGSNLLHDSHRATSAGAPLKE